MSAFRSKVAALTGVSISALLACAAEEQAPPRALTREQLLDPATCASCHPKHYREWASSMHAYAADDPVFRAMNARGQRETQGALGSFCVGCHAPLALREGATRDGLNVAELPPKLRGVTCYFCHNAVGVGQHFNNDVQLANDTTMRAGIADAQPSPAHSSAYSPLLDRNQAESATLCGSCHDVVTPSGVHLERTFREYQESLFAKPGAGFDTCAGCHMPGRGGAAARGGPTDRVLHEHVWPGVDVALTDFPDRAAQRRATECALASNARVFAIEPRGPGQYVVKVETSAGHAQPSGTALDRRLWIELTALDAQGNVLFQSGALAPGELEEKLPGEPGYDPQLALFRDWIYDAQGAPKHMFWEAAASPAYPSGYVNLTLPAAANLGEAHTLEAQYRLPAQLMVDRLQVRLKMRAVGMDVFADLVRSGDLDPKVVEDMPTFTLHGASVEWRPSDNSLRSLWPADVHCPDDYACVYDPTAPGCAQTKSVSEPNGRLE